MTSSDAVTGIASALSGFVFGFALEKGRVFEPLLIVRQMAFSQWTMMKMFLGATAVSLLSASLVSVWKPKLFSAVFAEKESKVNVGVPSVIIGGALLGGGMALTGACPGTVLAQIGTGVPGAVVVILGGIAGTMAFAATEALWAPLRRNHKIGKPMVSVNQWMGTSFAASAVPLAAVILAAAAGLDYLVPWGAEHPRPVTLPLAGPSASFLSSWAWHPVAAGMVIGLLQVPVMLFVSNVVGCSSSYVTLASWLTKAAAPSAMPAMPCLSKAHDGMGNLWQVIYVTAAAMGAGLSSTLSGSWGTVQGLNNLPRAFAGGFVLLYGSRLAGGCTSGHGISGMGMLFTSSFIAVAAMFGGGALVSALV